MSKVCSEKELDRVVQNVCSDLLIWSFNANTYRDLCDSARVCGINYCKFCAKHIDEECTACGDPQLSIMKGCYVAFVRAVSDRRGNYGL